MDKELSERLQRALQMHRAGKFADAEALCKSILKRSRHNVDALHLLALAQIQSGRKHDAIATMALALALAPTSAAILSDYASMLMEVGNARAALDHYDRALALHPGHPTLHCNRGKCLHALGQYSQAIASFDRVLTAEPAHADALNDRAHALLALGQYSAALQDADQALSILPRFPAALNNRGVALRGLRRRGDAREALEAALNLQPAFPAALYNLGLLLLEMGESDAARNKLVMALELNPDLAEARWALATGRIPLVATSAEVGDAAYERIKNDLHELDQWFAMGRMHLFNAVGESHPFYLAYQERNNRTLFGINGALCSRLMQHAAAENDWTAVAPPEGPVRVLIISAQISDHPVWNAIVKGWISGIDSRDIELHLLHLGTKTDHETSWAMRAAKSFPPRPQNLHEAVARVREIRPHIIVYPEIGMDPLTLKLASMRLAPAQMAAWGHPETTGLPTMDYYLSADLFEPDQAQDVYSEKLVRLPGLGSCYRPLSAPATEVDLTVLGISSDVPLLLCPGTPYKYSPGYDAVLIDIAKRLATCQFVFFLSDYRELSEKLRDRIAASFRAAGMNAEQFCKFIPWQDRGTFYALMRKADVFLDTMGFSGFNTAMQAVECGLPIVTVEGRFMRGRFASAILRHIGLDELVAGNAADYADIVARVATDRNYRNALSARIEHRRTELFNDQGSLRYLEKLFVDIAGGNIH